ncbi:hypothetical protein RN001_004136 [Aquatica leii]|uniref:GIY-YIG domain-containing protein n=1 Tax=Aquatica leii TaxID=1421715 RepID=A0AAN7ST57_9COLE|nr:hypothetical protein RN001_004136 [Aquatica leii]
MDYEDYDNKIKTLLQDGTYQPITTDPTTYLETTTKNKIKTSKLSKKDQQKIHKEGAPLRPIVSSIWSPLQELAKFLAKQLQPYAEEAESYVKNASHFIERIKDITLEPGHMLNKQLEMQKIQTALQQNGFSKNHIRRALRPRRNNGTEEDENKPDATAFLPYIKGTTDKISKVLKKHNIQTIFNTVKKINQILPNPKTKIDLESQGVYKIPCKDCDGCYVGQTNRRVNIKREEHRNAVIKQESTSSLAEHVRKTSHEINFDETKVIANVEHKTKRIIREAVEIEKLPNSLNTRDDTQRLPTVWKPALTTTKTRKPTTLPITKDVATADLPKRNTKNRKPTTPLSPEATNHTNNHSCAPKRTTRSRYKQLTIETKISPRLTRSKAADQTRKT